MNPATAVQTITGVAGLLKAPGAVGGGGSIPTANSASSLNSAGSYYNIVSGSQAQAPLIGGFGFSNTQLLIAGGLALVGFLFYKKVF